MAIDVFLSAGRPANAQQAEFLEAVERFLRQNGMNPRTPGRTHQGNKQPLKVVAQCMRECEGIVVVAYERIYAAVATERRGGTDESTWRDAMVPTVWNQVEGTMAYTLGLPVLVVAQNGLRSEALLESKYDWNVRWMDLDPQLLHEEDFRSVFEDWRKDVEVAVKAKAATAPVPGAGPSRAGPQGDASNPTIGTILTALKGGSGWKVITTAFTVLSGTFFLGYKLGVRDAPGGGASSPPPVAANAPVTRWLSDSGAVPLLGGRAVLTVDSTSATGRWAALTLTLDGNPSAARIASGGTYSFLVDGRKHVLSVLAVEPRRVAYSVAEAQ